MANTLKVSCDAIIHLLKINNCTPRNKTYKLDKARQYTSEIISLYETFNSIKMIAAKFNSSVYIIQQILRENGIYLRNKNKGGIQK